MLLRLSTKQELPGKAVSKPDSLNTLLAWQRSAGQGEVLSRTPHISQTRLKPWLVTLMSHGLSLGFSFTIRKPWPGGLPLSVLTVSDIGSEINFSLTKTCHHHFLLSFVAAQRLAISNC